MRTRNLSNGHLGLLVLMAVLLATPAFAQTYTVLSQYASGDGWSSDIFLTNQAAQAATGIVVSFYGNNGAPLTVETNIGTGSSFTLNLNAGASQVLRAAATGSLCVGYIVLKAPYPGSVTATEVFRYEVGGAVVAEVGVPQLGRHYHFSFPAEVNTAKGINTGVAFANPTWDSTAAAAQTLILSLVSNDGTLFRRVLVPLGIGEHIAMYLNEAALFPGLDNFTGVLSVSGPKNYGVQALRQDKQAFGGIAVDYGPVLSPFVVASPSLTEVEPNNVTAEAQLLTTSCVVHGVTSTTGDLDYFYFIGRKNDIVSAMVDTQGMGSSLDSTLRLQKADGTLVANNYQNGLYGQNDSFVHVVLPEDGRYNLRVSDYYNYGGADYRYRLHVMFPGGEPPAQPQVSSLNPTGGTQGSSTTLIVQGTNLSGATGISFSPATGIAIANIQSTATQVTAQVAIAADAPTGSRSVTVSTSAGTSNALSFYVAAGVPQITSLSPSSGKPGETVSLTISGTNLGGTTAVNFTSSSGITVSGIQATGTQVTCSVVISSSAATGSRSVTVSTPGGASNALTFTINAAGSVPQISSLTPSIGRHGETVSLIISGTNLGGATAVSFTPGTGIVVSNIQSTATQVTCSVEISSSATTGDQLVRVTTPNGTSYSRTFTILTATAPTVSNLVVNTPTYSSPIATVTGSFDFSDPDGDIIYTGSSTGDAKIKFSVSLGQFSCWWATTGTFLDKAGQTGGHVNFVATLLNPNSLKGEFLVSFQLLDAAGNQSNSITFDATIWYCQNFQTFPVPDGSGNLLSPALPPERWRTREGIA